MENASKALLIAAAVLIVILLVAFGMKVLNSTSETKDSAITTGKAISAAVFNAKFKSYIGASKSRDEMKALIDIIEKSNRENSEKDVFAFMYTNTPDSVLGFSKADIESKANVVPSSNVLNTINGDENTGTLRTYNVYEFYDKDGYIRVLSVFPKMENSWAPYRNYDKNLKAEKGW